MLRSRLVVSTAAIVAFAAARSTRFRSSVVDRTRAEQYLTVTTKEDLFFFRLEASAGGWSKRLQAREQRALAGYADSLAELLAAETGAAPEDVKRREWRPPMMGVQRSLIDYVRHRGPQAVIDTQAFDRIISNLVSKAIRDGAPPILVPARRSGTELCVTIDDHGPGVAAEFVGSLFERFTRGATNSSQGAGLSIAQSYARAHGGTITYEPLQPQGARFRLTLPLGDRGAGN